MKKFCYLCRRVLRMNYRAFFACVKRVSRESRKAYLVILLDVLYCGVRYQAGYTDYELFGFARLDHARRKTYITRGVNHRYVQCLNAAGRRADIDHKLRLHRVFAPFIRRDWADLRTLTVERFTEFLARNGAVVVKPADACCGRGVEKYVYDPHGDFAALYERLRQNRQFLLEGCLTQHERLAKLYPGALNTLRLVTIVREGRAHLVYSALRIGRGGAVVDNFNHGGLFTTVDQNGTVDKPAIDREGKLYYTHPDTGTAIVDLRLPDYERACAYTKKLALVRPDVGYVGWDIALTPSGPELIEGNTFPGHDLYQSRIHSGENRCGLRPTFDRVIYGRPAGGEEKPLYPAAFDGDSLLPRT